MEPSPRMFLCTAVILLTLVFAPAQASFELTILHTNDIHARIQEVDKYNGECSDEESRENKCFGGYARIKTKVDDLRAAHPNSILVDAGDQFQGTLWYYFYRGVISSHFMNQVKYDAMALGNHEFDDGPQELAKFLKNATFPVLSCNVDTSKTPEVSSVKKSLVLEVGGQKIGVIGYTTADTPFLSNPGMVKFSPVKASLQAEADRLKTLGVDKIVAVGHQGYDKDQEMARQLRGVDVIVGGHTNSFLYSGNAPSGQKAVGEYPTVLEDLDGNTVLVVQDYAYGKYLGKLHVTFDDAGRVTAWNGNPVLLDHTVEKAECVLDDVNELLPLIKKREQEKIGISHVKLVGDRSKCRRYECNFGNLIADAMVWNNLRYSDGTQWSKVSVAIVNGGGIRADINRGDITVANVLKSQPFGNTVDIVEISGETLLAIFEHNAANRLDIEDGWGGFLQVSGIRVVYNQTRPIGRRVVWLDVLCTDCEVPEFKVLDPTKNYMVLMQEYLIRGSKGYSMIKENLIKRHTIGTLDSDILLNYIKGNSHVTQGIDGRIQFMQDIQERSDIICGV